MVAPTVRETVVSNSHALRSRLDNKLAAAERKLLQDYDERHYGVGKYS